MEKVSLRTNEAMEYLSVSRKTIEEHEKRGLLTPIRVGRTKYFDKNMLDEYLGKKNIEKGIKKKIIAYYRVSTNNQKSEIESQRSFIENYASVNGIIVDEYLSDIGSGINFKRKNFLEIINQIEKGNISELIITHKDRLVRFAFELIEERCRVNGTKLTVINMESTSPQEELVEDLMTIVHVFSSRLYGLRRYKNEIKKVLNDTNT